MSDLNVPRQQTSEDHDSGTSTLQPPQPSTGLELSLWTGGGVTGDVTSRKRLAVPGPSRIVMDKLREHARISEDRARLSLMQRRLERVSMQQTMNSLRVEIDMRKKDREAIINRTHELEARYQVEIANLKDGFLAQASRDDDSEVQMTEHIVQCENEIMKLQNVNQSLVDTALHSPNQAKTNVLPQWNDKVRIEMQAKEIVDQAAKSQAEHERQISEHESEIMILRKRLQTMSPPSSPDTPLGNAASAYGALAGRAGMPMSPRSAPVKPISPRVSNIRSRLLGMQNPGPSIGIVPLQPPQLAAESQHPPRSPTPSPAPAPAPAPVFSQPLFAMPSLPSPSGSSTADMVKLIVGETLRQIGMQGVEISGSGTTSRRARQGQAAKRDLIRKQQAIISSDADKSWKDAIRQFWRIRYERQTADDFADYTPVSTGFVTACDNGAEVPSDSFQLDFSKGWNQSRWNRIILRRIYDELLAARRDDGGWNVPDVSEDYLMGLLHMQLKRCREAWARAQPKFLVDVMRGETAEEVVQRVVNHANQRYKTVSSRSRRQRKYEKRVKIVEEVIAIKTSQDAVDLEAWIYFRKMLQHLSIDGMSSEEDGAQNVGGQVITVFLVKLCVWRADEISQYLKFIDKEADNPVLRNNKGSKACPRIPTEDRGSTIPSGLPRKMYNSGWLEELEARRPEFVLDVLRISAETFELMKQATR